MGKQTGVTLLELMLVVVILGILAVVAYPSYQNYLIESRRSAAQGELMKMQLAMEAYRVKNTGYAADLTTLGYTVGDPGDYYSFAVSGATNTYSVTASAKSGTSQSGDSGCTSMSLNQNDSKTPTSCWNK
ncbi:type IV pilin protein [Gallaecimonas sp. GXIMD4217]|uniref:type IV pilin protein n=1 Tax=Gallaecimonas sp. GXIMD4217 TaxID=3131927 RepID=UPI00311AE9E6